MALMPSTKSPVADHSFVVAPYSFKVAVISFFDSYGNTRLEAACARALAHDNAHYRTVKTILATNADQQPLDQPQTPAAYARARFTRSAADLFAADSTTVH
jgi:hypothetical protein